MKKATQKGNSETDHETTTHFQGKIVLPNVLNGTFGESQVSLKKLAKQRKIDREKKNSVIKTFQDRDNSSGFKPSVPSITTQNMLSHTDRSLVISPERLQEFSTNSIKEKNISIVKEKDKVPKLKWSISNEKQLVSTDMGTQRKSIVFANSLSASQHGNMIDRGTSNNNIESSYQSDIDMPHNTSQFSNVSVNHLNQNLHINNSNNQHMDTENINMNINSHLQIPINPRRDRLFLNETPHQFANNENYNYQVQPYTTFPSDGGNRLSNSHYPSAISFNSSFLAGSNNSYSNIQQIHYPFSSTHSPFQYGLPGQVSFLTHLTQNEISEWQAMDNASVELPRE